MASEEGTYHKWPTVYKPPFGTSRVAVQTLSLCLPLCTNHRVVYADEEGIRKDYPCVLYVTGVCNHAHVPRSFVMPFILFA